MKRFTQIAVLPVALLLASSFASADQNEEGMALLKQVEAAYQKLPGLSHRGTVHGEFEIGAQSRTHDAEFTGSFLPPNRFRHQMEQDLQAGSTGEKFYLYQPQRKIYLSFEAPEDRPAAEQLPEELLQTLRVQDPAMLLAVLSDGAGALAKGAAVTSGAHVEIDGGTFPVLDIRSDQAHLKLLVDPQSHLIRRIEMDLTPALERQGVTDVAKAAVVIDYVEVRTDAPAAEAFAWSPPAGARDAARQTAGPDMPAMALVGQPAPDFALPDLQGQEVKLSDLSGQVVVLDFWASWCGPCVQAMPEMQKIHEEKSAQGLRLFGVNVREDSEKVQGFLNSRDLSLPVLLDGDGAVAQKYRVTGIPQTVVIGKDGAVRKIFVGFGPGTKQQLTAEIDAALAQ